MSINVEAFADYMSEDATGDRAADLTRSLSVATALLTEALSAAHKQPTADVLDQLTLDVASAVYRRADNNGGTGDQYDNGGALRAPNDPLQQVMPILRKYVVRGL